MRGGCGRECYLSATMQRFSNRDILVTLVVDCQILVENGLLQSSIDTVLDIESNRKAITRNWGNQKANSALKTKTGNKIILQIDKIQ